MGPAWAACVYNPTHATTRRLEHESTGQTPNNHAPLATRRRQSWPAWPKTHGAVPGAREDRESAEDVPANSQREQAPKVNLLEKRLLKPSASYACPVESKSQRPCLRIAMVRKRPRNAVPGPLAGSKA